MDIQPPPPPPPNVARVDAQGRPTKAVVEYETALTEYLKLLSAAVRKA